MSAVPLCSSFMSYILCKWNLIFKWNISICVTTCSCYISCYNNKHIWIITKTWFDNFCLKVNAWIIFISLTIFCIILIINDIQFFVAIFEDFFIIILLLLSFIIILFFYYLSFIVIHYSSFEFPFYIWHITTLNQTTVTAFFENWKILYSNFSMIKNIVALPSSGISIKLICCFKSGFSNAICLLKSIAITF